MSDPSDPAATPAGKQSDLKQTFLAYMKTVGLLLIGLIIIGLLVWPTLFNLPPIDYANLSAKISALNAPEVVKQILLFFVTYHLFLLLCALFGASVGASEILSRYRDEPFIALMSPPGLRYLAVNAGISLAAFYLLHHFGDRIFPGLSQDPLMMSIVAGFGAMIVMRSKIFNFKTESGESYAVGPDAVLSILLASVDREIDRYRASRRQSLVYEETQNIEHPASAPDFLRTFLVSYQNLSNKERQDIDEEVRKIYNQADLRSPRLKFMTAAFGFLNIMGERNFKALVHQLKKYEKLAPEVQPLATDINATPDDDGDGSPPPPSSGGSAPTTSLTPAAATQMGESTPPGTDTASTPPVVTDTPEAPPKPAGPDESESSSLSAQTDADGSPSPPAQPVGATAANDTTATAADEIADPSEVEQTPGKGDAETVSAQGTNPGESEASNGKG